MMIIPRQSVKNRGVFYRIRLLEDLVERDWVCCCSTYSVGHSSISGAFVSSRVS